MPDVTPSVRSLQLDNLRVRLMFTLNVAQNMNISNVAMPLSGSLIQRPNMRRFHPVARRRHRAFRE